MMKSYPEKILYFAIFKDSRYNFVQDDGSILFKMKLQG